MYKIGKVAHLLDISIDTLRYYEKIQLLTSIKRTSGGVRLYSDDDLSRVQFIRHAQNMGFSLEDIKQLLCFRDAPREVKPQVRELVGEKLAAIEAHIEKLTALRDELTQLVEQCQQSAGDCPILKKFEEP